MRNIFAKTSISQRNLFELRDAIANNPQEVIEYIDGLLGSKNLDKFLEKYNVLGMTTAYAYNVYMTEFNGKLTIVSFTRAVKQITGYRTKTVMIDGTTRNVFME